MANYISEDAIQKQAIQLLLKDLHYDEHLFCQYDDRALGRKDHQQVISLPRLRTALGKLNPHLPPGQKADLIEEAIRELTQSRQSLTPLMANKAVHQLLKKGYRTEVKDAQGVPQPVVVLYLDFYHPEHNHFMVVEELPIVGKHECRTDLLLYVNGIPLVFIELKNSNVEVESAYHNNLHRYKQDIPQLFAYNAFVVLSNGLHSKMGSFTAGLEHLSEWKRVEKENETYNPNDDGISLERILRGMCDKTRLLDLIENFIFYFADSAKIIAKNHQYLGVNNGIASFENRLQQKGRLGVFWHTQGSGKSFSMIFFAMKVIRKYTGDYTFVIVTDRDSLDNQIFKNFLQAEVIGEKDEVQAKSRDHLKEMLGQGNHSFIFTLIQKFGTEKGEDFPQLTDRKDIIVMVDEAHRSQYNTLADNMRRAMPNANYLAFTGTPLLDANETTREWFGEYVSEYNFAQSMEDGATVPLYYENRVPQVQLNKEYLNDDLAQIIEADNLTTEQEERLKKQYATELEVIKRDARLDTIAEDIVQHFPYREYQGKAMVISVDKYTTVKMYNKVQAYWKKEKQQLNKTLRETTDSAQKDELRQRLEWMRETEMYVVISKEGDEEEKFSRQQLDIRPHRKAMEKKYGEKKYTLEERFKQDDDPFRLVFLCSKWLTGFDSPTVSTLYLDKPMQNHTLMQTIARANRVAENKACGIIVDYFGVFENLEKALEKYGKKHNGKLKEGDRPVQEKKQLRYALEEVVALGKAFLTSHGCDIDQILSSNDVFKNIKDFRKFANLLSQTEEIRKEFNVHQNAITNIYRATQPDKAIAKEFKRTKEVYEYLRQIIQRELPGGDYQSAFSATRSLLDENVYAVKEAESSYEIKESVQIDLRNLDLELLQKQFRQTDVKYLSVVDFKGFLEEQLERMLQRNTTRMDFAHRLQEIIDEYNTKTSDVNRYFEELKVYAEKLRQEDLRAQSEGLTEAELQVFDLLYKDKLTKAEKQRVKLAAQELLAKLKTEGEDILVVDWHKNERQRIVVERYLMDQLYPHLQKVYDNKVFKEQSLKVFDYMMAQADLGRGIAEA